jgi:hypothetical protein
MRTRFTRREGNRSRAISRGSKEKGKGAAKKLQE